MKETILIVDDDPDILNLVELYVVSNQYRAIKATSGQEALDLLGCERVDLILLDVMLPDMDGFEVCHRIREKYHTPVIFVTAKGMDQDLIHGLTVGGDDYMVKPFNSLVLLTKIRTLLRRCHEYNERKDTQLEQTISFGELTVYPDTCKVRLKGKDIKLTPKEFDILTLLLRNRGRVYSIQKIHDAVWGEKDCISDNAIMVHIANIRNKIEQDPRNPDYIKTVWGFGYKI